MALNESGASIQLDLIGPLVRLIVWASRISQVWITTHSQTLAEAIRQELAYYPAGGENCKERQGSSTPASRNRIERGATFRTESCGQSAAFVLR
jgi:predicted ATPase